MLLYESFTEREWNIDEYWHSACDAWCRSVSAAGPLWCPHNQTCAQPARMQTYQTPRPQLGLSHMTGHMAGYTYTNFLHQLYFGNSIESTPDLGLSLSLHIESLTDYSLRQHLLYLLPVFRSRIQQPVFTLWNYFSFLCNLVNKTEVYGEVSGQGLLVWLIFITLDNIEQ